MTLAVTIAEVSSPNSPFILQGQPYEESLEKAASCGYEAIEIQLPRVEKLNRDTFFTSCDRLGLQLVSITTGLAVQEGLSLSSHDEAIRCKTVQRMFEMIDLAADCGHHPDVMIGLLSGRETDCPSREAFLDNLGRSLKAVSDYAKDRGIRINLEPVNHLDCPGLNTWEDTVNLLDRYHCDCIFLGLDLYHMNLDEADMIGTICRYGSRIGSVQLMDRNRQVPGNGDFDFEPILSAIRNTGYDGPIVMECLPLPDPDSALKKAADFYHRAFGA